MDKEEHAKDDHDGVQHEHTGLLGDLGDPELCVRGDLRR